MHWGSQVVWNYYDYYYYHIRVKTNKGIFLVSFEIWEPSVTACNVWLISSLTWYNYAVNDKSIYLNLLLDLIDPIFFSKISAHVQNCLHNYTFAHLWSVFWDSFYFSYITEANQNEKEREHYAKRLWVTLPWNSYYFHELGGMMWSWIISNL